MSRTRRPTSRPALLAGDPRGGSGGLPSLVRVTGPRYDTILGNRRVALFGNMGPDKRSEGVISPSSLNPGGPPSGFHASGASTPRREVFALRKLPGTGAAPIGRSEAVIGHVSPMDLIRDAHQAISDSLVELETRAAYLPACIRMVSHMPKPETALPLASSHVEFTAMA